jgi:hypothetical protein
MVTPWMAATAVAPGAVAPLVEKAEYVKAPTGPALTIELSVVGTDTVAAPAVSVAHGVVLGFAIVGSTTMVLSSVMRAALARHPKGVVVAAVAVPALARTQIPALSKTASGRALPCMNRRRAICKNPPRVW